MRSKVKWYKLVILILISGAHFSCGLKEYYYLDQVPESYITRTNNTLARIRVPQLDSYYASGYSIFYKIYISDFSTDSDIQTSTDRNSVSPTLANDFSSLDRIADPTNTTVPSVNTFSALYYYELELASADISRILGNDSGLAKNGGSFNIDFSGSRDSPFMLIEGGADYSLYRSNGRGAFSPEPDRSFRGSPELKDYTKATSLINADVSGRSSASAFAYVSMYITAVGVNPENFTRIYSKPTHISIFRLPDVTN